MKARNILIILIPFLLLCVTGCGQTAQRFEPELVSRMNAAAVELDLDSGTGVEVLDRVTDGASLVCLGESRHDIHEQFVMKHHIVWRLVMEKGFRVFVLEESLPYAAEIDAWLQSGDGDLNTLVSGMSNWFIWDTEEMRDLISWMREYNASAPLEERIRFYGSDMTDPVPGFELLLPWLKKIDEEAAEQLRGIRESMPIEGAGNWMEIMGRYSELSISDRTALASSWDGLLKLFLESKPLYSDLSSDQEWEWMWLNLQSLADANTMYSKVADGNMNEGGVVRELAMARNLEWIHRHYGVTAGTLYWAHNLHVGKDVFDIEMANRPPGKDLKPAAAYLADTLGSQVTSIGFSSYAASDPQWMFGHVQSIGVDALFHAIGKSPCILDMQKVEMDSILAVWAGRKRFAHTQGGTAAYVPARMFDAIVFIDTVTRTTYSPEALRRFQMQGSSE